MSEPSKQFTTDGCSGGMSIFWRAVFRKPPPWESDCIDHDRAYWAGGSAEQKKAADIRLAEAVRRRGYPIIAKAMYYAVRIGGVHWLPTAWRWGYGYRYFEYVKITLKDVGKS